MRKTIEDIPFSKKISFLNWIIGLVMFVTIACTFALFLINNNVNIWLQTTSNDFSITLPNNDFFNQHINTNASIIEILDKHPDIEKYHFVINDTFATFFAIITGIDQECFAKEKQFIIDVQVKNNHQINLNNLEKQINDVAYGIKVNKNCFYRNSIIQLCKSIQYLLTVVALICFCIMILITFFTLHIQMVANRKDIAVLNLVGATSYYVAKQFCRSIFFKIINCSIITILITYIILLSIDVALFKKFALMLFIFNFTIAFLTAIFMSSIAFMTIRRYFYSFEIDESIGSNL